MFTKSLALRTAAVLGSVFISIQTVPAQTASASAPVGISNKPAPTVTTTAPPAIKVTQIDIEGLKKILKPDGRPLLINFWATWCPPCTEEFPDLVKLHGEYRGKVDFVTVSLDELSDINTFVPKFLGDMKSEMPAYLLHTQNENAAIALVSRDWAGNLPMTVLYDASGKQTYAKMGKIKADVVRENIKKLVPDEPIQVPAFSPAK
jgi:thiol-disulfide isomerase/thioredoxin